MPGSAFFASGGRASLMTRLSTLFANNATIEPSRHHMTAASWRRTRKRPAAPDTSHLRDREEAGRAGHQPVGSRTRTQGDGRTGKRPAAPDTTPLVCTCTQADKEKGCFCRKHAKCVAEGGRAVTASCVAFSAARRARAKMVMHATQQVSALEMREKDGVISFFLALRCSAGERADASVNVRWAMQHHSPCPAHLRVEQTRRIRLIRRARSD
eukprot:364631-Chlamydomonas_euryale.AAC.13